MKISKKIFYISRLTGEKLLCEYLDYSDTINVVYWPDDSFHTDFNYDTIIVKILKNGQIWEVDANQITYASDNEILIYKLEN